MVALEEVSAPTMPSGMGFDYMGMSFQEEKASQGVSPFAIFGLSLLLAFLILAALYESWPLPFSVLLSVPIAIFRALLGLLLPGFPLDIYGQIGLVVLIGLAAMDTFLIIVISKGEVEHGPPLADDAVARAAH